MQGNLLWIDVVGDQTGESVRAMGVLIAGEIEKLRSASQPVLVMDNLTNIGETPMEAVKAVAILARVLDYDRAALLDGKSALLRVTSNLLLKSIGRPNAQYFSDVEAATAWLQQG
jgi:hypothetical protein